MIRRDYMRIWLKDTYLFGLENIQNTWNGNGSFMRAKTFNILFKKKIYMAKKDSCNRSSGEFSKVLKKVKSTHKIFYPTKQELNILNFKKIREYLKKVKPDILIHAAGLSRPMKIHTDDIKKSIDLNIIGTANITKTYSEKNIKLIFLSTSYIYPDKKKL